MDGSSPLTMVVGLGDPAPDAYVLREAAVLAEVLSAHLLVVQVEELAMALGPAGMAAAPPPGAAVASGLHRWTQPEDALPGLCDRVATVLQDYKVTWQVRTAAGDPADALLEVAGAAPAYCVVLGSRGEGFGAFVSRLLRPSVSRAVLRGTPTRVLIVHPDDPPALSDEPPTGQAVAGPQRGKEE